MPAEPQDANLSMRLSRKLYDEARRAAHRASLERESSVTLAEWVREAMREKLKRET